MQLQGLILSKAVKAAARSEPPGPDYTRLYAIWFSFGFPAFAAVLAIFWLMVVKPA